MCDYWHIHNEINNEELNTIKISKIFNTNRNSIVNYLHKGKEFGWCNYNPKEEKDKNYKNISKFMKNGKTIEVLKDDISLGIFESMISIVRKSEDMFGVKITTDGIRDVINGRKRQYKGFTFKYIQ